MFVTELMDNLFHNGGEAYTYSSIKNWLMSNMGLTDRQVAGTVGAAVRYGYIWVATRAGQAGLQEAVFVR